MPRFTDEWVIDRVLFDYVAGGSCACCGLQHFLPNNTTADLIQAMSDLETDQAQQEVAALAFHPWPIELRDQIWADRVRLRQRLKRNSHVYGDFWKLHGTAFGDWCRRGTECLQNHTRWLQLPRSEVMEYLREEYNIHSAFAVVLCTVLEQVAAFDLTQYPPDGRGDVELNFERILYHDRRGGFTINLLSTTTSVSSSSGDGRAWNEENLNIWLERMKSLGGPKLLERGPSTTTTRDDVSVDAEDGGGGDADDVDGPTGTLTAKSSFQSDRRIVRLLIARYWAKIFQQKYLASISSTTSSNAEATPISPPSKST